MADDEIEISPSMIVRASELFRQRQMRESRKALTGRQPVFIGKDPETGQAIEEAIPLSPDDQLSSFLEAIDGGSLGDKHPIDITDMMFFIRNEELEDIARNFVARSKGRFGWKFLRYIRRRNRLRMFKMMCQSRKDRRQIIMPIIGDSGGLKRELGLKDIMMREYNKFKESAGIEE